MVEIKQSDLPGPPPSTSPNALEEDRYRLVYSKSKVYVNPTAYARDNIPGFLALVKRVSLHLVQIPSVIQSIWCYRKLLMQLTC